MDNVVQNINIEDIIPSDFQTTMEENKKVEELAEIIKIFGLIDPIIVRPKNEKYEIVLGIEKYHASKIAGLNSIPAIIKKVDDETFYKYLKIDSHSSSQEKKDRTNNIKNKEISNNDFTIPLEKQNNNEDFSNDKWNSKNLIKNSDIINLSELSKREYERNDFRMNTEQFNNNMINNIEQPQTIAPPTQGPTFGERYFPSLEDEPTNMNMMGNTMAQTNFPEQTNINNNLIDLTDTSMDIDKNSSIAPAVPTSNLSSVSSDISAPISNEPMMQNDFVVPTPQPTESIINLENLQNNNPAIQPAPQPESIPTPQPTESIINLENLQNNNPAIQPTPQSESMDTLNADFGVQTIMQPQFDMTQNMTPQMSIAPEINQPMNNIQVTQNDFVASTPTTPIPEVSYQPIPEVTEAPVPQVAIPAANIEQLKDITPVTNTIKNLASSLEAFGYKININEEELATSIKITIEVEK